MKIYTSYFGNAKALAKAGVMIVSVARWQPRYLSVPASMLDVAPTPWMMKEATREQYLESYQRILSQLNAENFIKRLETLSGGRDVALCCYEKPGEFCHRRLLADFLSLKTGIEIEEFGPKPEPPKPPVSKTPSLFDGLD